MSMLQSPISGDDDEGVNAVTEAHEAMEASRSSVSDETTEDEGTDESSEESEGDGEGDQQQG